MPTDSESDKCIEVLLVAVPETAGSALYGMIDVLNATGNVWQSLTRSGTPSKPFRVRIVSTESRSFRCGNGIPVMPDCTVTDDPQPRILILPEIWLDPDDDLRGRYPALMAWIRRVYRRGAALYSACSGAVMLAETGLLDGCPATSHWGYQDLFRCSYPKVLFRPEPNLVFADPTGRIVTAGGTTSWHDLALHIISRYVGAGEALSIAKVYLLKWHDQGQLPYAPLIRNPPHGDSVVRECEQLLRGCYRDGTALQQVVASARIPERTLKRRFRAATGSTLIEYIQGLRVEEAKRLLESGDLPVDEIAAAVGYEDNSFFRRLFKRLTGLTPGQYRRLFRPVMEGLPVAGPD